MVYSQDTYGYILLYVCIPACIQVPYEVTVSRDKTEHHLDQILIYGMVRFLCKKLRPQGFEPEILESSAAQPGIVWTFYLT